MTSAARQDTPKLPRAAKMLGAKPLRQLRSGIRFGETMRGQIALRATDPEVGYADPGAMGAVLHADVYVDDLDSFLADPHHRGRWAATLQIPMLGGRFTADDGDFALFRRRIVDRRPIREMVYDATLTGTAGEYRMRGRKVIEPGPPWRFWRATTTLNIELLDSDAAVVASGQLRLSLIAFLVQLLSLRVTGSASLLEKPAVLRRFARFFVGAVLRSYVFGRRW